MSESLFLRDPDVRAAELARDLNAVWPHPDEPASLIGWVTLPSVARRVSTMFADRLDARVDRVMGVGEGGDLLAMALSLTCGRPFCWVTPDGEVTGVLRAGESVALVSVHASAIGAGQKAATAAGATEAAALSVLGADTSLFVDAEGGLAPTGKNS